MRIGQVLKPLVAACFLLSSCASTFQQSQQQASICRNTTSTFETFGQCVKAELSKRPGAAKNKGVQELFAEIDRLTARALNGEATDEEAYRVFELKRSSLQEKEAKDNETAGMLLLGAALVGAAIYAASEGGGGGGGGGGYAWDQFDSPNGGYIWRCRDKSNGQFAVDYLCAGEPKVDFTWPGK